MRRVSLIVLGLMAAGFAGCAGGGGKASVPAEPPRLSDVRGRYILVVSDVDMDATAFATAELGERDPEAQDQVTIFTLPILEREEGTPWAQVHASNSAVGPPPAVALDRGGRMAFVVESRGAAPRGATAFADLPAGQLLTAIDMADPLRPARAGTVNVGPEPTSVDAHPDGDLVAIVRRAADGEHIVVVPVSEGGLGEGARTWPVAGVEGAAASSIAWHPSGRYLAVTLPTRNLAVFYEFSRTGDTGELSLAPWGNPVEVGKYPYSGRFTPDGRFFITTDLQWGPDVEGFNVGAPPGRLTCIRLSDVPSGVYPEGEAPIEVEHAVASVATVGISPEGLAISADGAYVVTANLGQSFLPMDDPRVGGGSLTLLKLDRAGRLTPVAEYPMNGMPEGICFDAAGRMVIVAQFRSLELDVQDGELAFWRLNPGRRPSLQQADFYLGVGRGPHGVLVAP